MRPGPIIGGDSPPRPGHTSRYRPSRPLEPHLPAITPKPIPSHSSFSASIRAPGSPHTAAGAAHPMLFQTWPDPTPFAKLPNPIQRRSDPGNAVSPTHSTYPPGVVAVKDSMVLRRCAEVGAAILRILADHKKRTNRMHLWQKMRPKPPGPQRPPRLQMAPPAARMPGSTTSLVRAVAGLEPNLRGVAWPNGEWGRDLSNLASAIHPLEPGWPVQAGGDRMPLSANGTRIHIAVLGK